MEEVYHQHAKSFQEGRAQKLLIIAHLASSKSSILSASVPILESDVDSMFECTDQSGSELIFHLENFERQERSFGTVEELLAAIASAHERTQLTKDGIQVFQSHNCMMYDKCVFSPAEIAFIYENGAGPRTLQILDQLAWEHRKFWTLSSLVKAIYVVGCTNKG